MAEAKIERWRVSKLVKRHAGALLVRPSKDQRLDVLAAVVELEAIAKLTRLQLARYGRRASHLGEGVPVVADAIEEAIDVHRP